MDERQTKIREGAGLEESRINTDLIDFLNKWSSPVLIVIGLVGLGWAGMRYLERSRVARTNDAFAAYEGAISGGTPSPASLRTIAADFGGVGSIAELALLRTVDVYLRAAISRVEPGAEIDPTTGSPRQDTDVLDDERVTSYLAQARDLSRQVAQSTAAAEGKALLHIHALMRLGASLEGLGSLGEAKAEYERAAVAATAAEFPELALVAQRRAAATDALEAGSPALPSRADLAPLPGEEPVEGASSGLPSVDDLMALPPAETGDPDADPSTTPGEGDPAPDPASDEPTAPGAGEPGASSGTP
jgi:hypothetical protein